MTSTHFLNSPVIAANKLSLLHSVFLIAHEGGSLQDE